MLRIRRAETDDDRRAVAAVSHLATRPEAPVEHYTALRLAHPRRAEGTWWLLESEGRPVSSLMCYPLLLSTGGARIPGYGLGAVATVPEARRRGHAAALCRHAVEVSESEGRHVGLLFSAIPPAYYERMGFVPRPAWEHVAPRLEDLAGPGPQPALVPIDPRRHAEELAELYERHHLGTLHARRDTEAFLRSLVHGPGEVFLGVGDPLRGYARVGRDAEGLEVTELVVPEEERAPVLRALGDLARRLGLPALFGWFDPVPALASCLEDRGRATTLPMVRGLDEPPPVRFWPTDYF